MTRARISALTGGRSAVELLAEGEVLEGELPVAAAEEREEAKQVE